MSKMADINKAESFAELKEGYDALTPRAQRILKACDFAYKTRRELSEELGVEISSLCAPLFNLVKRGYLREAFSSQCIVTGKMVVNYTTSNKMDSILMVSR